MLADGRIHVERLRTNDAENPIGIGTAIPRFSWQLRSDARGVSQTAYRVRVAAEPGDLQRGRPLVWDSGRVQSDASTHRPYAGPALASGRAYVWDVQVWDEKGLPSARSARATFELGLLAASDWSAAWIEPGLADDPSVPGPSPMLRRPFALSRPIRSARAYVSSHGLYELYLNGTRVGDQVLTPGWTSYKTRLQYQTYDVTPLVKRGPNVVGAVLGNGWYRGNLGFTGQRN